MAVAVRPMMSAMTRQGPDSERVEQWPQATLGHRRLAILDLSAAGHQPMLSDDGQTALVFNGCIYPRLQTMGIESLVPRLRGTFAFAISDNHRRKLANHTHWQYCYLVGNTAGFPARTICPSADR
jgi:asparagine synthase (glutamine-hydrolysing)